MSYAMKSHANMADAIYDKELEIVFEYRKIIPVVEWRESRGQK